MGCFRDIVGSKKLAGWGAPCHREILGEGSTSYITRVAPAYISRGGDLIHLSERYLPVDGLVAGPMIQRCWTEEYSDLGELTEDQSWQFENDAISIHS
ncbi:hypothetical protein N7516_002126 [Penicillium verrucosum]|uniref:uncharacterized protein n=1 Tax=Penicillium verrucosum TaxID=60171 RepID=UPI00254596DD|nr:uncharacterized protein N7516_002126 [Penicillium verrucosum]KAJ5941958.1 hypothetical protein N7516_002126 [Penicillium verrucosum]